MKQLLFLIAILLGTFATKAQNLDIINNSTGDLHVVAYAYQPGCGSPYIDHIVVPVTAPWSATTVDLTLPSSWGSGTVPGTPWEIVYAEVSRDAACPGTLGWGMYSGPCMTGVSMYQDMVQVGDPNCGWQGQACMLITLSGNPPCNGFNDGDVFRVDFAPGGLRHKCT